MDQDRSGPSTNETLLIRIKNPLDAEAWRLFVDLYTPLIYRYGCRRGLQDADSRDVVQDVLTRVNRSMRSFEYDPERGRFRAWLGTLSRRVVIDYLQKNDRHDMAPGDGADEGLLHAVEGDNDPIWLDEFRQQMLHSALQRIQAEFDPEVWQAFEQAWLQQRPVPEICQSLNKNNAWVYKAKFNILARLKTELQFLSDDVGLFHQD